MNNQIEENSTLTRLESNLKTRLAQCEREKAELVSAITKVAEIKALFRNGKTPTTEMAIKSKRTQRAPRGKLRGSVLAILKTKEAGLGDIVKGVKGNYGTVAQLVAKLKKEKLITQGPGRGAPYALAKAS